MSHIYGPKTCIGAGSHQHNSMVAWHEVWTGEISDRSSLSRSPFIFAKTFFSIEMHGPDDPLYL
jgi:hypothetical protein